MTLDELLKNLHDQPDKIDFNDVMETINNEYNYSPSTFTNGQAENLITNESGTNEGSCKIFSFAKLNSLTKDQTLACFGKYYREDVLQNPSGKDHANIRTFMKYGLDDIIFTNSALDKK